MKYFRTIILIILALFIANQAYAQITTPSGISSRSSSQLIYWYDLDFADRASTVQVTNTNDNNGVWIHVQIFRNGANGLVCDERNFVDFLTPNDTHLYSLGQDEFPKNTGEAEGQQGESTTIDLDDPVTKGFVIITPVVSESDFTAISFQHLIGHFGLSNGTNAFRINAMGRDAVNYSTGEIVPDNTPLDGTSNGFINLQPEELVFNNQGFVGNSAFIVGINFIDNYGDSGLLGYNIEPGSTTWNSFIFDWKEDPTSCGVKPDECFFSIGLNDDIVDANTLIDDDVLCSGTSFSDIPFQGGVYGPIVLGWTRIFVSEYDDNENQLGLVGALSGDQGGAKWMYTRGETTGIPPVPTEEDCSNEGDEDEDGFADCLDTDCATSPNCETGLPDCNDDEDNDGDSAVDCADIGCDGTVIDSESGAVCETGGETSCSDGFDNDGDGDVDSDDTDCQVADTGSETGDNSDDGGGCSVAKSVTTADALVNILLPLLPILALYASRKIRKFRM